MSKQPVWQFIKNIGDVNPLDHGGVFIFEDSTGVYDPEIEIYDPDNRTAHRFSIDRLEFFNGFLIPFGFSAKTLPYPIERYKVWFNDDLNCVSLACGVSLSKIRKALTTDNIVERANAYEILSSYFGLQNFDEYPLILTEEEAESRYEGLK